MPDQDEHKLKASANLELVGVLNSRSDLNPYWDWQVTVLFYSALHLMNSYLARYDLHYRSHNKVEDVISPFNVLSVVKVPEDIFTAYVGMKNLSKRARYLVNEDPKCKDDMAFFTDERHFKRAIKHFEKLAQYFDSIHKIDVGDGVEVGLGDGSSVVIKTRI